MTAERLAHLRGWVVHEAGRGIAFVYSDTVVRLLDEREALLDAAVRVVVVAGMRAGPLTETEQRLRDAIAKAESP